MNGGKLYVFEGFDGVGKTTIVRLLDKALNNMYIEHSSYSFPGKNVSSFGNLVYDMHHNRKKYFDHDINNISLLLMHIAAHLDILERLIMPDLSNGKVVLLDRFWWSTFAYGIGNHIDRNTLKHILYPEFRLFEKISISKIFLIRRNTEELYSLTTDSLIKQAYEELTAWGDYKDLVESVDNIDIDITLNTILSLMGLK